VDAEDPRATLSELTQLIERQFGRRLLGLYLFGSLAAGGFVPGRSDIDLVAALADEVSKGDLVVLGELHETFEREHPEWRDRIEVLYISRSVLGTFASAPTGTVARVSPGEPLHHRDLDGNVGWLHWTACAIAAADGTVAEFQAIGRDVTDKKHAEEATQNLTHVSRLAAIGELTATIAHELNQPLGAILANADLAAVLLEQPVVPVDDLCEIVDSISKQNLRAVETIQRIRALSRKRAMEIQPLDLNETVSDAIRLAQGDALRRRVQIHLNLFRPLPPFRGDPVHLQHVLLNLVLNSMDAMSDNAEPDRQVFVSTAYNGKGMVEVAVRDIGRGIPTADLNRVFDSFFTTKRDGMGLGLSIARSIVLLHSGRIWAENNSDGRGATFHLSMPTKEPSAPAFARSVGSSRDPKLKVRM